MPPSGLRLNWPGASWLSWSSIAGDTLPPSRLAPGQFERNECIVISETAHWVMRTHLCRLSIGLASALAFADASGAASEPNSDWPAYLGDTGRSLYSPLRQINRSNVARLKVAWTYDTGDKGEYQANDLIVAGVLYTASPTRKVIALDASTGQRLWQYQAQHHSPVVKAATHRALLVSQTDRGSKHHL